MNMKAFYITTRPIRLLCSILLLPLVLLVPVSAQVITNITPDGSLGTTIVQNGSVHTINGGTMLGSNQFHSFDRFDVGLGDTARFTGPASVENILSRVTGGTASMIDGTLQSAIADANLYLLNPSGVVFGPSARLDVTGAFHVSTADGLRLGDDGTFRVSLDEQSVLSVSAPSAFGFLQDRPAAIRIGGSQLAVCTGQTLSVVGGDIDIVGNRGSDDDPATLAAPGGQLHLASITSPGKIAVDFSETDHRDAFQPAVTGGAITLSDVAALDVRDDVGESIRIRGGDIMLEGSVLIANSEGADSRSPGDIRIEATGAVRLLEDSAIHSNALGQSASGDVVIMAEEMVMRAGGRISSGSFGPGDGGNVTVRVRDTLTITGVADLPSGIYAQANTGASGSAGDVLIEAAQMTLSEGGLVNSSTFGSGNGGNVTVQVRDTLTITGASPFNRSSISGFFANTFGRGKGGQITVSAQHLRLADGAQLQGRSGSIGDAGDIAIAIQETLTIENGAIRTEATRADGGNILIAANLIQARDSRINTSVGRGEGSGGNITVNTNLGTLENSTIRADAFGGPGGNITIQSNGLIADVDSRISASSEQSVDGTIEIQGLVDLAGSLTAIDPGFAATVALGNDPCVGRLRNEHMSQFTLASRDRIPTEPGGLLPSPLGTSAVATLKQTARQGATRRHSETPLSAPVLTAWHRDCGR